MTLTENMRCKDQLLRFVIEQFRKGNPVPLIRFLNAHRLTDRDAQQFACAPIISPGNEERAVFNPIALKRYARAHKKRIISWTLQIEVDGKLLSKSVKDLQNTDKSYTEFFEALRERNYCITIYFCEGAPIYLLTNIKPLLGLANGVNGWLYGLEWSTPELRRKALEFIESQAGDVHLPDELAPAVVLVRACVRESLRKMWPADQTVVPGDVVFPIQFKWTQIKLDTAGAKKQNARLQAPMYDLAFLKTIHKAQSVTYKSAYILNLLRRKGRPGQPDYHALCVAVSRGVDGSLFRAIFNSSDINYIFKTLPPPELLAFEEGWGSDGIWNQTRCFAALDRIRRERGIKPPVPAVPKAPVACAASSECKRGPVHAATLTLSVLPHAVQKPRCK
jgi:hypothetical protein